MIVKECFLLAIFNMFTALTEYAMKIRISVFVGLLASLTSLA